MLCSPQRDDTAVAHGGIEYLSKTVEREDALKLGPLIEEALKPPVVEAVHAPAVSEVPINVQLRCKLHSDADAVKRVVMPLVCVEMTAEGKPQTAPREKVVASGMLAEESQSALNIGLERSNDCLESFIHGWCEQRLTMFRPIRI